MAYIFKASRDGANVAPTDLYPKEAFEQLHLVHSGPMTRVKVETPETRKTVFKVRTTDHEITYRQVKHA